MDRTLSLQLSGQTVVMARQAKSASHRQEKENFRSVLGSSGVLCCEQKDVQRSLRLSVSKCASSLHELQVRKLQLRPGSSSCRYGKHARKARRRALACCSVVNEVGQNSPQVPPGPASPDYLKDQLEALQDEALQVRNRYNNARARFMRLTEVAQQLRQRAAIDLDLGNEDSARKSLIEKQKVIHAAELSQRRAQLLEALSIKLGEAISVKETQYIVALSIPQREEPTVRVVSPKGEGSSAVDLNLDKEGNPTGLGIAEPSRIGQEGIDSVDPAAAAAEDTNGDSLQVVSDSADVAVERETVSVAEELGYSTDRHLYGNGEDVEATVPVYDSRNMNIPLGKEDSVRDDRDMNVQSGGSLLPKDSLQGESFVSCLDEGVEESVCDTGIRRPLSGNSDVDNVHNLKFGSARNGEVDEPKIKSRPDNDDSQGGSEDVGTAGQDIMGHSERMVGRESGGEVSFNDGRRRLLERLIQDMDHQIAAVESILKTGLSQNMDSDFTELQLIEDLLQKVRSLKARISEVVLSLARKEA